MIRKRNGRYEVIVYLGRDGAGRRKSWSRTVRTKREAIKVEGDKLRELDEGRRQDTDATLGQLLDRWYATAQVERSTAYTDRLLMEKHVRPVLGDVPLSKLRASDLDDLYRTLERGTSRGKGKRKKLAAASVRKIHNRLSSALSTAVRWEWIATNPAERADPPAEPDHEPEVPPTELVVGFLALLRDRHDLHAFVWLVASTGLRRGAACALRRSDVDVEAGVLRTMRALGQAEGAPYVKATKTGARHPLALGPETVVVLEELMARQDKVAAGFGAQVGPGAYLFSHHDDCALPWRPDWPTKQLRKLRLAHPEYEGVTLRSLRRWMITHGLDRGFSVKAVGGRASHSRASTTLDRYAAWVPPSDRALAETIESVLLATESDEGA